MSYTAPTISSVGLVVPQYGDIVGYLVDQYKAIFGSASYLGPDSSDYQDIGVRGMIASDNENLLQSVYYAQNPQTAIGASLDRIGRLIGTGRKVATHSTALVTLAGTPGAIITNGVAGDINGNLWNLPTPVTIPSGGTISVTVTAQAIGNITAEIGTITSISTPTLGWASVSNAAAATPGNAVESDAVYRARLLVSQATPSRTLVAGTAAAVAAVSGVTRSQVYENPTGDVDSNGLPAHSITCVVEGGDLSDIAQAIYDNRGIGARTNGTTTVSVTDPSNSGISLSIEFTALGYIYVYVTISVHGLTGFTTATQQQIAADVTAYLNSLGIGQPVIYSELYGAALNARPNPDQPLFSIRALSDGAQAAQTTATLTSGSANIVVTSASGIATGQVVVGTDIPANTTVSLISGSTITLSANATAGGTGVVVSFFPAATSDIVIPFDHAAKGVAANVVVNLV